jgi:prepilin-type N-terminal cleavage/methylation domain-containing protein
MSAKRAGLGNAGFTLTELLITLGLLSVVLSSVVAVMLGMQRGYVRQREAARGEDALRIAETTILTIFRTAEANPRGMTGPLAPRILANPLSHATFDNVRIVSDFNPPDGDVLDMAEDVLISLAYDTLMVRWQQVSGASQIAIAYPVRSLLFEYYTATGTVPLTATQIALARRVRFVLTAPRHSRTNAMLRRETWVFLRNRR